MKSFVQVNVPEFDEGKELYTEVNWLDLVSKEYISFKPFFKNIFIIFFFVDFELFKIFTHICKFL